MGALILAAKRTLMIIRSTKNKSFEIAKGNFVLGELKFPKWYSMNSTAKTADGPLEIKSKGAFSTTYLYTLNGKERGQLTANWKGCLTISVNWGLSGLPVSYQFKTRGFWNSRYEIIAANEQLLFVLTPKWSWSTWSHSYEIEQLAEMDEKKMVELLLYAGHAARVKAAQQAAAMS